MTLLRSKGSLTPLRLTTARTGSSTVVKRRPQTGHDRRRRVVAPSSVSREADEGATTRRRRSCPRCGRRFTTVEEAVLAVLKRSGVSEPFDRNKVIAGVRRACQGRPVDEAQLAVLAAKVEDAVRATGSAEVPSNEVGLAILAPLRYLDEVAYLRFASVYRSFSSAADFEKEIAELKRLRPGPADGGPPGADAGAPPPS